jgi:AraC-like DNA-binding protein
MTFSDGHVMDAHSHRWGQLIYAATGTMRVLADDALWLVPQGRALWAPPAVRHAITMRGSVAMRTIYIPPERADSLPEHTQAIEVDALLRELILHIAPMRLLREDVKEHERLASLFLDRLSRAGRSMFMVPMPRDASLRELAEKLRDDPARNSALPSLAKAAGMSARTLQRRFREETGLRFVEWRQRLKLMQAITVLGAGASVTEAGAAAGYANTSAFIAAFRAHMGETPKAFVRRPLSL